MNFIQYLDEIIALTFFLVAMIYCIKRRMKIKIERKNLIIICLLLSIIFIGILGNIMYNYQTIKIAMFDMFLILKFFLVYFLTQLIFKNKIKSENKILLYNSKILIILFFILTILNYIFEIWKLGNKRYGIPTNQLFYEHSTYLSAIMIFIFANYLYFTKKVNLIYCLMTILVILSTMRMKAIAFVIIAILLYFYIIKFKKKINFKIILGIGLIAFIIGWNQIQYYFVKIDNSARSELLKTSIEIANDKFPIGAGLGTFGSYFSGKYYSNIYEIYGINDVYGITENNYSFVADAFWPMLLGQVGYLGTLLYVLIIVMMFFKIQKSYDKNNPNIYYLKIVILLYLLISSTAESAFVSPMAIPLSIMLGL